MGRRGPIPTPTEVLNLRGSWRGKINKNEPQPEKVEQIPDPPDFLIDKAREEWVRVGERLCKLGILRGVDIQIFAAYCQSFGRWVEAEEWLTKNGSTIVLRDKDGLVKYVQQVPHVSIAKSEKLAMIRSAAELGITPSSRSRITVEQPQKLDDKSRYIA